MYKFLSIQILVVLENRTIKIYIYYIHSFTI